MLTRRDWLTGGFVQSALWMGACARKKSPRYQGYALIAKQGGNALTVIDLSRFQKLKEVALDAPPLWIVPVPSRSRAYILSADSNRMSVFNLDDFRLEPSIPLSGRPQAAKLSEDGGTLWVLLRDPPALAAFDAGSGKRAARMNLPFLGRDMDVWQRSVAISFHEERRVGLFPEAKGARQLSDTLDAAPGTVRFRGDGQVLLVGNTEDRSLSAIDAPSLRTMVRLPVALAPKEFCFNSDGGQLFVTGEGMDAVAIVNTYNTEVSETILAGDAPDRMAATSSQPQYLVVANPRSGDATVINIDNRKVLAQIPVGQGPGTVLLTPDNEYALVLNERSGDVAVIRLMSIREANLAARRTRTAALFTLIAVGARPVNGAIVPRTA